MELATSEDWTSRVMGPKQIPVRTTLPQEVKRYPSQEAPTLRQQKTKPRAYANEETTTTKSLSPELTATKKENQEATRLRTKTTRTTIMNKEETPDREQIATLLANSPYNYMNDLSIRATRLPRATSRRQKTKHASSRNKNDLLQISTSKEQDNMSKPVKTQQQLSRGSTSNEDRDGDNDTPEVSATPTTPTPPSGPDPVHITMAEIQTMRETTARAITDDLTKQNNQAQEEHTDAVKNLQIKFNEQQVKSKKSQDKDDPDKTTGQMKLRSIHSTCIRTNEIHKLYEEMQEHQRRTHEIQQRIESLQQTNNKNTSTTVVEPPRAQRQDNVTHTQTRSPNTSAT